MDVKHIYLLLSRINDYSHCLLFAPMVNTIPIVRPYTSCRLTSIMLHLKVWKKLTSLLNGFNESWLQKFSCTNLHLSSACWTEKASHNTYKQWLNEPKKECIRSFVYCAQAIFSQSSCCNNGQTCLSLSNQVSLLRHLSISITSESHALTLFTY